MTLKWVRQSYHHAPVAECRQGNWRPACIPFDSCHCCLQVRIAAAQQLPSLARVLGPAAVVAQVLPELKELLEDDEVQVRHHTSSRWHSC